MQNDLPPKLSLIAHFQDLPDPRADRIKDHDLIDMLVIAICTRLCAGESFNDMEDFGKAKETWFKTFPRLRNGIPSHDTFNRLFAALDPQAFLDGFLRWTQSLRVAIAQELVALDGCIVRVNAMGAQKKIAREIIEADADYVLGLKDNHENVFADRQEWEGLRSVGVVEAWRIVGARKRETALLSELSGDGREEVYASRPWALGCGDGLHWVLGVVFGKDRSRARTAHTVEDLAITWRSAVNPLKPGKPCKCRLKGKLLRAAIGPDYLKCILTN